MKVVVQLATKDPSKFPKAAVCDCGVNELVINNVIRSSKEMCCIVHASFLFRGRLNFLFY